MWITPKVKGIKTKRMMGKVYFSESGLWGFYFEPNGLELISQITEK